MSEYTSERTLGELISFSTLSTTVDPEQQLKDGMVLPRGKGLARGGGRAEKVELDEHVFRGRVHVGRGGWCGLRMSADGLWWPMNLFSNPEMQHACPVTVLRCSALVQ